MIVRQQRNGLLPHPLFQTQKPLHQFCIVDNAPRMGVALTVRSITFVFRQNQFCLFIPQNVQLVDQTSGVHGVHGDVVVPPVFHPPFYIWFGIIPKSRVFKDYCIASIGAITAVGRVILVGFQLVRWGSSKVALQNCGHPFGFIG